MRTLLMVILMMLVAVAAGLSFVLQAAAQEQASAELEFGCRSDQLRAAVVSGVPTLMTCTATARNTGSVSLAGGQLSFVPASNLPTPDAYYFWSAVHDGVPQTISETQLTYDFGDIAPGASSVIVLEIIVRSTHDYGADVVLLAQPDQREYARVAFHGSVTAAGPGNPPATLQLEAAPVSLAPGLYQASLTVTSESEKLVFITADVGLEPDFVIPDRFRRVVDGPRNAPSPLPGRFPLTTVEIEPYAPPGEPEVFIFDIDATGACYGGPIAIVATARTLDGRLLRPALLDYVSWDGANCVSGLPNGGAGPLPARHDALLLALALLLGGARLLALGLSLRRPNRAGHTDRLTD